MASVMRKLGRSPGWKRAVGWNCINSMSFTAPLARVHHSNAVSRSYQWIGCIAVYRFASACCHYSYFGQERIHFSCFLIQYVSTETFDAWCMAGDDNSQMMLGNDFYRIVICKYGNIGMSFYRFYQAGLYFSSCIVFVVQDTELGMASFFVEVEFSILFLSNPLPILSVPGFVQVLLALLFLQPRGH